MSFYNTTNETGSTLKSAQEKADNQKDAVLNFFRNAHPRKFTPRKVWELLGGDKFGELTSVRRAISDLTNKDHKLFKTDEKEQEVKGSSNFLWRLSDEEIRILPRKAVQTELFD